MHIYSDTRCRFGVFKIVDRVFNVTIIIIFHDFLWRTPVVVSASEMTYIVSSGALNSTHSLTRKTGTIENWCLGPSTGSTFAGFRVITSKTS